MSTREITYVSDSVLSVEDRNQTTEFCSPAKYYTSGSNAVTGLTSNERIPLLPLLEATRREALEKPYAESGDCGFEEERAAAHIDSAWAVHHVEGRWVAGFWLDGPIVCRGGTDRGVWEPLPASFTGDAPLPVPWAELQRRVPNFRDAAGAPTGAHLAVLAGDTLFLARVRDGGIGKALVKVPLGWSEQFVMLRWASAAEVARWNREIPTLAEPDVRVEAPGAP